MFNDGRFYPNTCLNSKGHIKLNISSYIHPSCGAPHKYDSNTSKKNQNLISYNLVMNFQKIIKLNLEINFRLSRFCHVNFDTHSPRHHMLKFIRHNM